VRRLSSIVQNLLLLAGCGLLGFCGFSLLSSMYYQARQSKDFDSTMRRQTAAPPPTSLTPGTVVGRLSIPRLHLKVMVVEGVSQGDLQHAAGHVETTALPGQPGNVGIAAHRDTFFRPLKDIHKDDMISVTTPYGEYHYRVSSTQIVEPENVAVLAATKGHDSLTLITCYPFQYVGLAPSRFIVHAAFVDNGSSPKTSGDSLVNHRSRHRYGNIGFAWQPHGRGRGLSWRRQYGPGSGAVWRLHGRA
jgi:sortase A